MRYPVLKSFLSLTAFTFFFLRVWFHIQLSTKFQSYQKLKQNKPFTRTVKSFFLINTYFLSFLASQSLKAAQKSTWITFYFTNIGRSNEIFRRPFRKWLFENRWYCWRNSGIRCWTLRTIQPRNWTPIKAIGNANRAQKRSDQFNAGNSTKKKTIKYLEEQNV